MRTDQSVLVVLDGSKALLSAVRAIFGARAVVQRCQARKRRNVDDHLPENMRRSIGSAIAKAYRARDSANAEKILTGLANQLERPDPQAPASLREGLDETLTCCHRLGCDPLPAVSPATTEQAA